MLLFVFLFLGLLFVRVHVLVTVSLGTLHHVGSTSVVVSAESFLGDLGERVLLEESEHTPSNVEGLEDISLLVLTLSQELAFESFQEQEVVLVIGVQGVFSNDSLHVEGILTLGVEVIKLVRNGRVIVTGESLDDISLLVFLDSNSRLHESGERGEHVDWWVDLSVVEISVNEDLSLGNVTSQIWDGMSDIIVGHGKNGQLSDRTVLASDTTSTLVEGGKIGVHVTRETTTSGHFFSGSRDFSEGVGVRGHIGEDSHDVHLLLVSEVLSSGEGETGSNNTLDGGIVGQVHEQDNRVHGAVDLEIGLEESSSRFGDTHSSENNGEVLFGVIVDILVFNERGLSADLGTNLIMGETVGREEGDLLSTGDGVHDINGGDTSLDHFLGVISLERVNRLSLDVEEVLSEYGRSLINWHSGTIELATEHLFGDGHLEDITGELTMCVQVIDVGSSLENLDDGSLAFNFEDLTLSHLAVSEFDVDDFGVLGELDVVECDEGTFDIEDCAVVHSGCNVVVSGDCTDVLGGSILFCTHSSVYLSD